MNKECYEKLSQQDRIEYMLDISAVNIPTVSISLGLTSVMLLLGIYYQSSSI